ncbi:DUF4097 domain-containing protein [Streptomyces virginiae]|uniref:DUF4097 family beta strand repeat-containing protein n=1 Tax=Streptomyces virginiae TaxID=1961 RepID=UPI002DDAC056|nr:DUF4097 family beta strand repeat-containing protein [Streptomyces virginiae]WSC79802.1 DUF4097 domain-containing protein [Streptomyces virginiae]
MTTHTTSARKVRTAITALGAGLLLAGCSFSGSFADGAYRTATADATVAEAVTAVKLTGVRSGSIAVTPGTGPGVTIKRTVHYRGDTVPKTGQKVTGGVLTFSKDCSGDCYVDYRLEVPAAATVDLESSSGEITVTGVAGAEVESDSGGVTAERIGGPLKVRTSSGGITATGLSGPSAEVRSTSGDAHVDFTKAPSSVLAETTSGDVTLKAPRAPYAIKVSTDSGDRDITLPDDPSATSPLSVKTSSGDIHISAV